MTDAPFATESGHWYRVDGTPCYTTIGANGQERPTTLRDARKLNLLPGVTSIIDLAAKPGLERWKRTQVLMAALTLPRVEGEKEIELLARIETDSREQGKRAALRGEQVHAAIERAHRGQVYAGHWEPWIIEARRELETQCGKQQWHAERSYAYRGMYGCRVDLHSDEWLIDIKTKENRDDTKVWDEHCMQLAANSAATSLPIRKRGILFVGRDAPWAKLIEVPEADIRRGMAMFLSLYRYWQAKTQYFPGGLDHTER